MSPTDPIIGKQLANYRVERVIGRGGMATVYYGWDIKLERPVAIKVIDARFRSDPSYAQRFVKEARAVSTWFHENILQVYYADDEDGWFYFVMEYIRGSDLRQLLDELRESKKLLPHEEVLRIGRAVGQALDYAHDRGIVHRDVKPANVMIAEDGRIVLTDFGLALDVSQGTSGEVFGSPHYISPEQARRSSGAVAQSDLYSLGVMLYEMLTGTVPFDDPSPITLALQHLRQPVPPPRERNPALNPATEKVLLKALEKSPDRRYSTAGELMEALEKSLHIPEETAPFSVARPQKSGPLYPIPGQAHSDPDGALDAVGQEAAVPGRAGGGTGSLLGRIGLNPFPWLRAGGCAVLLVAGLIFAWVLFSTFSSPSAGGPFSLFGGASETPPGTVDPADEPSPAISPTGGPTRTRVATVTSSPVDSPSPSATSVPPTPTLTPKPPTPVGTGAEGDYFTLYYDDTGLYFKNQSGSDRSIFPIAFERIENGQFTDRFEGWRWGNIYSNFRDGYCMVIEIINTVNHLDPPECQGKHLVIRTPSSDQPYIFWTSRTGSNQFRVLWDDEEVARCKIKDKFCEVYLP